MDKRILIKALRECGLNGDILIVRMAAILLTFNGIENAVEFVRETARRRGLVMV